MTLDFQKPNAPPRRSCDATSVRLASLVDTVVTA
jgi:hypothetical protein